VRELWQYFVIPDASDERGLLHYTNWAMALENIICIQDFGVRRAPRKRLEDIQIILRLSGGEGSLSPPRAQTFSTAQSSSLLLMLQLLSLLASAPSLFVRRFVSFIRRFVSFEKILSPPLLGVPLRTR
jgi:hypothetical protein